MARLTSAALRSARPRLSRASACAVSVGVTSPALSRFWVMPRVSRRKATLERCASTSDWLASTLVVGGDGIEQHALADIAQRLAARLHLQFRHPHAVGGLVAVEQRLRHRDPDGPGFQGGGLHGVVGQQVAHRLQAAAQARNDLRPVAGQGLRHVLVGGALPRPFGIELRIGLIGFDQRLRQGFGVGRGCGKTGASRHVQDKCPIEASVFPRGQL